MLDAWERRWAPYDAATYAEVLAAVQPADIVLDIGAGDLRLARALAKRARHVYAIELDGARARAAGALPANLTLTVGDARTLPFAPCVTLGVLLMRHCTHVGLYSAKLRAVGARALVTNARWGLAVECIDLQAARMPYAALAIGAYACDCGATGFVAGPPAALTATVIATVAEVVDCPACAGQDDRPA